jgi:hypothetical protein
MISGLKIVKHVRQNADNLRSQPIFWLIPLSHVFGQGSLTNAGNGLYLLSDQGSNLDSSEPKSDVLPVTPSDNVPLVFGSTKVGLFFLFLQLAQKKLDQF